MTHQMSWPVYFGFTSHKGFFITSYTQRNSRSKGTPRHPPRKKILPCTLMALVWFCVSRTAKYNSLTLWLEPRPVRLIPSTVTLKTCQYWFRNILGWVLLETWRCLQYTVQCLQSSVSHQFPCPKVGDQYVQQLLLLTQAICVHCSTWLSNTHKRCQCNAPEAAPPHCPNTHLPPALLQH